GGAEVRGTDRRAGVDLAGEEAGAERAPRHEPDAELLAGGEDSVLLDVASPQRIFALNSRDRVDGVGAANGLGARLGEAVMLYLALADQRLERSGDLLDRDVRVDAVLIK